MEPVLPSRLTMAFQFINNKDIVNNEVRRRIRRQAALEKNKGRKLHRKSRQSSSTALALARKPATVHGVLGMDLPRKACNIERPIGDGLVFLDFQPDEHNAVIKKGGCAYI